MTDFHAHILPGADHGSDGLETSLRQLALAEEAGIRTIVATPHFYPQAEEYADFLRKRERTYAQLLANYHGPVRILLGAEVHMCVGLDHLQGMEELCIPGTRVMLAELPMRGSPVGLTETFLRLMEEKRIDPILAHVDRYDPAHIENFFSMGLRGQVNASALCRLFGRRRLIGWIDGGFIHALGSDIHGTEIGYSEYLKARAYLGARADRLERRMKRLLAGALRTEE